MPQGRSAFAAAAMGGKIYVTGGDNRVASKSVFVYDPQANTWMQLTSMGAARRVHASAAVGGKLYVFGGDEGGPLSTVEIYDPASDSWAQGPSLTSSRSYPVAVAL